MARAGAKQSLNQPAQAATKAAKADKSTKATTAAKAAPRATAKKAAEAPAKSARARKDGALPAKATPAKTAKANATKAAPKAPAKAPAAKAPAKAPAKAAAPAKATPAKAAAKAAPAPPPVSPVSAKVLTKLKKLLEEERETHLRQAEDLAAEAEALAAERGSGDTQFDEESGEGDTLNVERERDLALSASARAAVEEIDRALARMEAGTYGVCERCGNKIAVARLEALPYAALCIDCKSRAERPRR
jgi:RNA polymerase-binding protein DksA